MNNLYFFVYFNFNVCFIKIVLNIYIVIKLVVGVIYSEYLLVRFRLFIVLFLRM